MALPAFLSEAMQLQNPRSEALRAVKDSEWESVLSDWRFVRLMLPLRQTCGDGLPDWVRDRVDAHLADNAIRFERIKQTYRTVAQTLQLAGADHVVLKGFSLFPGYVEHPRFRPQSDIDLYCPPDSMERAHQALIGLGYQGLHSGHHLAKDHLPVLAPPSDWKWRGNFFDPDIPIGLELHFCFWDTASSRISPQRFEEFWLRRTVRQVDEITFLALHPVDNLGYTALNLLRDLLRGSVAADQAYGLARFLHTSAEDPSFWQIWKLLHDGSERRLQAVSFLLAENSFGCRLSEEAREEIDRLPPGVDLWFKQFPKSVFSPADHRKKDSLWLHLNLVESHVDRAFLLFKRLAAIPTRVPTFDTVLTREPSASHLCGGPRGRPGLLGLCQDCSKYTFWAASRAVHHLGVLPVVLARGARYWMVSRQAGLQWSTGITFRKQSQPGP
jgi:hypothetical protein